MQQVLKAYAACGIITVTVCSLQVEIIIRKSVKERVPVVDYVDRYNVSDISRVISKLKKNKSPGADILCSEHFIYASGKLQVMLTMLLDSKT